MKACMQNLPFKNHFSERASKCMFLSTSGRGPRTRLRNIVKLLQQDWRFTFLRRISPVFTLTTCASTLNQGQRFLLTMWENSNWNQFFFQLFHFIATFNATAILGKLIFGRSNIFIFEMYFLHQFLDVCGRRKKILSTMIHSMNSTQDRVGLARCRPSSGVPQSTELSRLMDIFLEVNPYTRWLLRVMDLPGIPTSQ